MRLVDTNILFYILNFVQKRVKYLDDIIVRFQSFHVNEGVHHTYKLEYLKWKF